MKLKSKLILLFVFSVFMITSCEDEPLEGFNEGQDEEQNPNADAIFKAKISDTIDFTATEITAEITDDGLQLSGTMNNKRIGFGIPNPTIGNKDLSTAAANSFYNSDVSDINAEFYTAQEGTINIESIDTDDTRITGTFSGNFEEISSGQTINITEGTFTDVFFEDNDLENNQISSGSLTVDVDGTSTTFQYAENNFPDDQDLAIYTFIKEDEENTQSSQMITLVFPTDISEGTYDVNSNAGSENVTNPYSLRYDDNAQNIIAFSIDNSGQFNINNVSNSTLEGSFNMDGEDIDGEQTISFTNGSFILEFQ